MNEQIRLESERWIGLKNEIGKAIIGQEQVIDRIFIGLLCDGHILLEGVPGLAKTTLIKTVAQAIGLKFSRVQFTPDLLPSDLIGTLIYNPKTNDFQTKRGPIFANIVLADEINRSPAKVQSALLEAMQEHQVTIGEDSLKLDSPFIVLATQNPLEQEGTYRLPEAQLDRFMFKVVLVYPKLNEEKTILKKVFAPQEIRQILSREEIFASRDLVKKVYIDEKIEDYILNIVSATRAPSKIIQHGASPRATITLYIASKAYAFLRKRDFVIPDDVKAIAYDVLRHRIALTYEAEADGYTQDRVIEQILANTSTP